MIIWRKIQIENHKSSAGIVTGQKKLVIRWKLLGITVLKLEYFV